MMGVPVGGVVVGSGVLSTNKSGVFVGSRENGVAVGCGELTCTGVGVCKNGMEIGKPAHPPSRDISTVTKTILFIRHLR